MLSGSEIMLGVILIVGLIIPFLFIGKMFMKSSDA